MRAVEPRGRGKAEVSTREALTQQIAERDLVGIFGTLVRYGYYLELIGGREPAPEQVVIEYQWAKRAS